MRLSLGDGFVIRVCFSSFVQFNFVGRILGPRGLTAKQLEAETGCKIMVRGKGSMRDKKKVHTLTRTLRNTHRVHALLVSPSGFVLKWARVPVNRLQERLKSGDKG